MNMDTKERLLQAASGWVGSHLNDPDLWLARLEDSLFARLELRKCPASKMSIAFRLDAEAYYDICDRENTDLFSLEAVVHADKAFAARCLDRFESEFSSWAIVQAESDGETVLDDDVASLLGRHMVDRWMEHTGREGEDEVWKISLWMTCDPQ